MTEQPPQAGPGRPTQRMPRKKSANATPKPAAKPEPWMFPPPHAWTHEYRPAPNGARKGYLTYTHYWTAARMHCDVLCAKTAAKPEPWLFPPPHAWTQYRPAPDCAWPAVHQPRAYKAMPEIWCPCTCLHEESSLVKSCGLSQYSCALHCNGALHVIAVQLPDCQRQSGARWSSRPPRPPSSRHRLALPTL